MPFRSLDDLWYLIEDRLPQQAKSLLTKTNAWQERRVERKRHDRQAVLNSVHVNEIVQAMAETGCGSDPDGDVPATDKAWLPRIRLRH